KGDCDEGIAACQLAFERVKDPLNRAFAWTYLGNAYLEKGEYAQARSHLEEALERFSDFGFRRMEGWCCAWLGEALLGAGDADGALVRAAQGRDLSRRSKFVFGVGVAERALARIAQSQGRAADAITS